MKDITLTSVNWNACEAMQLLLKSYVKYHYEGEPLKLMLVDNNSTDGSEDWLIDNDIPFIAMTSNVGHEAALNYIYNDIKTKYCLLNDTDLEYSELCKHGNIYDYITRMEAEGCDSAGELIDKNYMNDIHIKDRIAPWLWLFNIEKMHKAGIRYFRDPSVEDWTYDVGSWQWEQMKNLGIKNFNMVRFPGHQDNDLVSMRYDRADHIGKLSWNLENHGDRYSEVMRRRMYVKERLKLYEDVDLKGKFI